jgi:hypothetical protein
MLTIQPGIQYRSIDIIKPTGRNLGVLAIKTKQNKGKVN